MTEERARGGPRASGGPERTINGRERGVEDPEVRKPYGLRRLILPSLVAVSLLAVGLGALYIIDQTAYVSTDNAVVTGTLIQMGAPGSGQVRSVLVDVGETVERTQLLATVSGAGGQPVSLRSSVAGMVLALYVNVGDTTVAGRPLLSILEPGDLWVQAQIDETLIGRVRPGQLAEVTVDAIGSTVQGRVLTVGRASAAASAPPSSTPSSSTQRVRQVVPVKIGLDHPGLALVYGGQAFVRIRTA